MKKFRLVSAMCAGALGMLVLVSVSARASAPAPAAAVLHQESRWLSAIVAGDAKTVAAMLSPNFTHITSRGELLHRAQELAALKKESFTMNPSEQTVRLCRRRGGSTWLEHAHAIGEDDSARALH